MNLSQLKKGHCYEIVNLQSDNQALLQRLTQVGFYPGERIRLKRMAPFFKDPILFEVGETQIAISSVEATQVVLDGKEIEC